MEVHDVTVLHTQPEHFFDEAYQRAHLFERTPRTYRIGYWYWEFDTIPDSWIAQAAKVDEVWTATNFVAKGLRERLSIPVRTLFPGVKLGVYQRRDREYFGIEDGKFTFLFTFHMMSVMERKNPKGLIRAFKQAFREEDAVQLVLKTSFGDRHPAQIQELRDAAAGANITVIDQVYNPDEVLSLMDACDAYVSLHRSEGLGLTMAEAMLMGKPVIATNFSGNVDFMDDSNSLLVPYELVKLGKPIPPYDADLEWAEPSTEHAAQLMRRVYDDQAWAREVGARGKASAEANLSLDAAGRRIAARLEEIKSLRWRSAGSPMR
jgi:glycosyltransferase involved in cell wall biosynthesis